MSLIAKISEWQQEAVRVLPPKGSDRLATIGGLPGPAFFPEGFGLCQVGLRSAQRPTIMAIGHNFGCDHYRQRIQPHGREDTEATWRNLDSLLLSAGSKPEMCFRTNWFVGLLPGNKQTGKFLTKPELIYEAACQALLVKQIQEIQPSTILLLGPEVASRVWRIIPALKPWAGADRWLEIDQSSVGPFLREVQIPEANTKSNVAALLHPSFGAANQGRRMKNMRTALTEVELIRAVLN